VGAVVLAIATTAILNGIDGAQGTGARNKARSVAAALAEQDQERMRAMRVSDLAGYAATRTVTVRGVDYTVKSSASWAVDEGGAISCSNTSKTAANIRILSEVTSPLTRGTVDQVSLVTPPAGTFAIGQGRAIVKVVNRLQAPIQGAAVRLTGPATFTGTTNSLGCVVFPFIPIGNYTAEVSGLGLVDWQGTTTPTKALGVVQSQSTLVVFEMDTAARINAQFDTKVGANAARDANSQWITVANSKLAVGQKVFEALPSGTPNSTVSATSLFPFTDGYSVFAGRCANNNPALAPTNNAGLLPSYVPTPSEILTTTPRIRVPAINLRVVQLNGTTVQDNATVYVQPADAACAATTTYPTQLSNTATPPAGLTTGGLPQPGFPYGTYKICAETMVSTEWKHGHADVRTGTTPFYDAKSTNVYENETAANLVNDTVSNTSANGNPTADDQLGSIRVRINRNGRCTDPLPH
jgi:hypothetical protein